MRANLADGRGEKLTYVKPQLATHGSVQQLTEGGHHQDKGHDSGSNMRFKPSPLGGKGIFGDW